MSLRDHYRELSKSPEDRTVDYVIAGPAGSVAEARRRRKTLPRHRGGPVTDRDGETLGHVVGHLCEVPDTLAGHVAAGSAVVSVQFTARGWDRYKRGKVRVENLRFGEVSDSTRRVRARRTQRLRERAAARSPAAKALSRRPDPSRGSPDEAVTTPLVAPPNGAPLAAYTSEPADLPPGLQPAALENHLAVGGPERLHRILGPVKRTTLKQAAEHPEYRDRHELRAHLTAASRVRPSSVVKAKKPKVKAPDGDVTGPSRDVVPAEPAKEGVDILAPSNQSPDRTWRYSSDWPDPATLRPSDAARHAVHPLCPPGARPAYARRGRSITGR